MTVSPEAGARRWVAVLTGLLGTPRDSCEGGPKCLSEKLLTTCITGCVEIDSDLQLSASRALEDDRGSVALIRHSSM